MINKRVFSSSLNLKYYMCLCIAYTLERDRERERVLTTIVHNMVYNILLLSTRLLCTCSSCPILLWLYLFFYGGGIVGDG